MRQTTVFICGIFLLTLAGVYSADVATNAGPDPEATTYQIRNVQFGDLLRPRDANNADGTPIVLYPGEPWKCMTWRLAPVSDVSEANVFRIKNLFTGKTFCADTNSGDQHGLTQMRLPKGAGGVAPGWRFVGLSDSTYEIMDNKSGEAVTAIKGDGMEVRVVTAPWENKDNQKWRLEKIDPKDLTM